MARCSNMDLVVPGLANNENFMTTAGQLPSRTRETTKRNRQPAPGRDLALNTLSQKKYVATAYIFNDNFNENCPTIVFSALYWQCISYLTGYLRK